jgi:hypothetical protein
VAVQVDYDLSAAGVISAFNNSDGSNDGRPKAAHSRGRKK